MGSNEIVIYKGRGKKLSFENINNISVIENKVILDGTLVTKISKRFNIHISGVVDNIVAPLDEKNSLKLKRLVGEDRIYDMYIKGFLQELSFKDSNAYIGISVENSSDLESNVLNNCKSDTDIFIKSIMNIVNIYEGFTKKVSKNSELKYMSKDIDSMLDLAVKANDTFTSCHFDVQLIGGICLHRGNIAPSLNSIISNLSSLVRKCNLSPSKKISSYCFTNILLKYHISKIYNSKDFRDLMGRVVIE